MGYEADIKHAESLKPTIETNSHALYELPCEPWARRVSGVFANQLANRSPDRAHAILTKLEKGGYLVSVRAPLTTKTGADELCRQFPTGGGRQSAAGVNNLPEESLGEFTKAFLNAPFE